MTFRERLALLLFAALVGATQVGCTASLERARDLRDAQRAMAVGPELPRPADDCRAIDRRHKLTFYGAEFMVGVGVGSGVVASVTHGDTQNAAIGVGIGASVVALALGYVSGEAKEEWIKECSR